MVEINFNDHYTEVSGVINGAHKDVNCKNAGEQRNPPIPEKYNFCCSVFVSRICDSFKAKYRYISIRREKW